MTCANNYSHIFFYLFVVQNDWKDNETNVDQYEFKKRGFEFIEQQYSWILISY